MNRFINHGCIVISERYDSFALQVDAFRGTRLPTGVAIFRSSSSFLMTNILLLHCIMTFIQV
ncbi:hypothetical protein HXA32_12690 [Salipaludibacillus agaradhaerens]|nr:hypothetical protein [Salipaludibacillus agaradhaerens]